MSDINSICLSGNLIADADLRKAGDTNVCAFKIASTEYFGENKRTLFIECNLFGPRAEKVAQYLSKGKKICLKGKLKEDTWLDKETQEKRFKKVVIVEDLDFMGTPSNSTKNDNKVSANQKPLANKSQNNATNDEDIPF